MIKVAIAICWFTITSNDLTELLLQAKAPGSPVLIIGTFCDQLPSKTSKHYSQLKKSIMKQFSATDASVSIEIKDIIFVKCNKKKQPCINDLQNKLHEVALTVKVPSG